MTRSLLLVCVAACGHSPAVPSGPPVANHASSATTPVEHDPDVADCQQRLQAAAAEFAKQAPRTYPPYAPLDFGLAQDPTREVAPGIATISILPGRSWRFEASVGAPDLLGDPALGSAAATWTDAYTDEGITHARRARSAALVLTVNSDRWGDYEPLQHPLVKLFFTTVGRAADSCVGG